MTTQEKEAVLRRAAQALNEAADALRDLNESVAEVPSTLSYSVAEVSEMTGVPKPTIYKAVREGSLRSFVLPGLSKGIRIPADEVYRLTSG